MAFALGQQPTLIKLETIDETYGASVGLRPNFANQTRHTQAPLDNKTATDNNMQEEAQ